MKKNDTNALHLARFPRSLHQDLKAAAAFKGMTLQNLIISVLRTYTRNERIKKEGVLS